MTPKTYDIDKITNSQKHHKKRALIIAVVSLLAAIVIFCVGTSAASSSLLKAVNADTKATIEEKADEAAAVDLGEILRQEAVDSILESSTIKAYSTSEIYSMDLSQDSGVTVADLKLVTKGNLKGLEEVFWQLEQDYDVNCLFVMAIAAHESANGTICFRKNNMFGYGTSGFSSKAECVRVVGKALANSYLAEDGRLYKGKTVEAVHKRYAASPTWDEKVVKNMVRYYSIISESHNDGIEALK